MVRALITVAVAVAVLLPAQSAGADPLIVEMRHNLDRIGCGHDAPFALLYLRTTEAMRKATRNGKFSDRRFWNKVIDGFGRFYLDPVEAWRHGQHRRVPRAWRIAFRAADRRQVLTLGDLLLGINAHINRDLAFIYYRFGVTNYADHLYVNTILAHVQPVVLPEIVAELDPTLGGQTSDDPRLKLDIFAWRELAWNNARRLAAAPDRAARRAIAAHIEHHAARLARRIRRAFPASAAEARKRDAYCRAYGS
jgi:hypothetical protein